MALKQGPNAQTEKLKTQKVPKIRTEANTGRVRGYTGRVTHCKDNTGRASTARVVLCPGAAPILVIFTHFYPIQVLKPPNTHGHQKDIIPSQNTHH